MLYIHTYAGESSSLVPSHPSGAGQSSAARCRAATARARALAQGPVHSMAQELPISRPFTAGQVDDLLAAVGALALIDWYVDVKPHIHAMEALLHNLRALSTFVTIVATRAGELHLQVRTRDHFFAQNRLFSR